MDHPINPIFHTGLRHLSVKARSVENFWEQLDQITLPSLETFSVTLQKGPLGYFEGPLPSISFFISLVIRSNCSLKKLILDFDVKAMSSTLIRLFSHTPELESLELGSCHAKSFEKVLQKLVFDKGQTTLLPKLRSLTLIYRSKVRLDAVAIIPRIASSRESVTLDDSSPGQLLNALQHIRLVSADYEQRHYAICALGGWRNTLEKLLYDMLLVNVRSVPFIILLTPYLIA